MKSNGETQEAEDANGVCLPGQSELQVFIVSLHHINNVEMNSIKHLCKLNRTYP